jgi:predicted nucleic acid-binding Zn ribbon protein
MGFRRYCVVCGRWFVADDPVQASCSNACEHNREREIREYIDAMFEEAIPEALAVLGLESIDEYPAWKAQQKQGSVYFIQAGNGAIKIGFSKDIEARLADLQVASPVQLRLLGTMNGTKETEKNIQDTFADLRLRGEWFEPARDLLDFLAGHIAKNAKR